MSASATVEELANMAKLESAKSLSASQLRKKAAKDLMKLSPEASKKAGDLKLEGRGFDIFPFVIALVPAIFHDIVDIVGDGIMLALNAIGGTIAVIGLKSALASLLLAFINPLYLALSATLAVSAETMGMLMIALGWVIWFFFLIVKLVFTAAVFILTAGRLQSLLQHTGFFYEIVKLLYIFILGVDNFPAIGWLPLTTLGVVGGMILMVMSLIMGGFTSPNKDEQEGEPQPAAA